MHPAATGAKKPNVNKLTTARTSRIVVQVSCHTKWPPGVPSLTPVVTLLCPARHGACPQRCLGGRFQEFTGTCRPVAWRVRSTKGELMKGYGRKVLAAVAFLAVSGFISGCGGGDERAGNHQIWFMGSIFNGATAPSSPTTRSR
jgi:hypothetical protein